ncbi:MAG TPA: hypothetical protein VGG30_04965 [Pirellulales bacterium]|jgi:predicted transcriptional regulator
MHQVNLNDQLYQDVQRRAAEAGFTNVDDYVADVLSHDLNEETPNLDHFFTPERMAQIDQSLASAAAGNVYTSEQVDEELAKRRDEWLRQHPGAR